MDRRRRSSRGGARTAGASSRAGRQSASSTSRTGLALSQWRRTWPRSTPAHQDMAAAPRGVQPAASHRPRHQSAEMSPRLRRIDRSLSSIAARSPALRAPRPAATRADRHRSQASSARRFGWSGPGQPSSAKTSPEPAATAPPQEIPSPPQARVRPFT